MIDERAGGSTVGRSPGGLSIEPADIELLHAIARLLTHDVMDALRDDVVLAARVGHAADLLDAMTRVAEEGPAVATERRERLSRLLRVQGDLMMLEDILVERVQDPAPLGDAEDRALRGYLMDALRSGLRLTNPRFDGRLHPEEPHA